MGKCSQYIILQKGSSIFNSQLLHVNLTGPWVPKQFLKYYSEYVVRVFLNEIMHESIDWVQQMALPNMTDPIQHTAGLNRTTGDLPMRESSCSTARAGMSVLLLSGYSWNTGSLWVSHLLTLRLELHHQLPTISSLVTQILGLPLICLWEEVSSTFYYSAMWFPPQNVSNLHNHVSQSQFLGYFLLPLRICLLGIRARDPIGSVSLENPN